MRFTVELPTELGEWVRENGGSRFLRKLAHNAAAGYLVDPQNGLPLAPPHPGRSGGAFAWMTIKKEEAHVSESL